MNLLLDIGNSRCKYVFLDEGNFSAIQHLLVEDLSEQWLSENCTDIDTLLIASVRISETCHIIKSWCEKNGVQLKFIESESSRFGLTCAYKQPNTFGVDRWLALLGTLSLYKNKNCLVIDAGTATTVDYLDDEGVHQGGLILPGIDTLFNSLLASTDKIEATQHIQGKLSFGKDTSACVNNASWLATSSMISSAIAMAKQNIKNSEQELVIVLTGGNAQQLHLILPLATLVVEELIFLGMEFYC